MFPRAFLLWQFLDLLYQISSAQRVLHQVSQFRKLFRKMVWLNFVPWTFLLLLYSIKMRVLKIWGLEDSRLTKTWKSGEMEGKDGKCEKRISHIDCQLPVIFSIFSLMLLYKILIRKYVSRCNWHNITQGSTW